MKTKLIDPANAVIWSATRSWKLALRLRASSITAGWCISVPLRSRRGTSRLISARSEVIAPGDSRRVLSVEGANTMANLAHGEGGRDLAHAVDERACGDPRHQHGDRHVPRAGGPEPDREFRETD